jgi:chromate transporter
MAARTMGRPLEVLARFLRLGLTSFGGPVAHLGYFRAEFVGRARWLDDETFGEIVALCSVLPGPTSSQVGIVLGALSQLWLFRLAPLIGGAVAGIVYPLVTGETEPTLEKPAIAAEHG